MRYFRLLLFSAMFRKVYWQRRKSYRLHLGPQTRRRFVWKFWRKATYRYTVDIISTRMSMKTSCIHAGVITPYCHLRGVVLFHSYTCTTLCMAERICGARNVNSSGINTNNLIMISNASGVCKATPRALE